VEKISAVERGKLAFINSTKKTPHVHNLITLQTSARHAHHGDQCTLQNADGKLKYHGEYTLLKSLKVDALLEVEKPGGGVRIVNFDVHSLMGTAMAFVFVVNRSMGDVLM
jgi:hypothetical protein